MKTIWEPAIPSTVRVCLMRKEGFAAFFEDFSNAIPSGNQYVRAIEDRNFVFVHVHQKLNDGAAEWVTAHFRSDENGCIVEHWDVIDAYQKPLAKQTRFTRL